MITIRPSHRVRGEPFLGHVELAALLRVGIFDEVGAGGLRRDRDQPSSGPVLLTLQISCPLPQSAQQQPLARPCPAAPLLSFTRNDLWCFLCQALTQHGWRSTRSE